MAEISSYPLKTPKPGDLITFSETYDANAANPVIGNPTKSATISSINALTVNGTANKIALFTTANSVGDSVITQSTGKIDISGQLESGDISVYNTGTNSSLELNSSSTASGGNYIHAKKSDSSNQWVLGSNSVFDDRIVLRQYNVADIIFANNSGDAMVIASDGSVGIGTTSPSTDLHVAGNIKTEQFQVVSGNDTTFSISNYTGNAYINGGSSGDVLTFGAPVGSLTTNIDVKGKATAEELESTVANKGLILKSPDGTRYRVTVANGGTLSISAV
jgi:hypothetical protein